MFISEKTDVKFNLQNCDMFFALHTAYRGIEYSLTARNFFDQVIEKGFLKMAFSLLKDAKGKLLFVVAVGKKRKETDRLIASDPTMAVALANLLSQISEDQRSRCRNCNYTFKTCFLVEILKNYRQKLAISHNS